MGKGNKQSSNNKMLFKGNFYSKNEWFDISNTTN